MVKEFIKRQIRKTGTYRVVQIKLVENKKQVQSLRNDKEKLIQQKKQLKEAKEKLYQHRQKLIKQKKHLQNSNLNYESLVKILKNENTSIKLILIDEKIYQKDADFSKFTVVIPYREIKDQDRGDTLDINLNYLSSIGVQNVVISEHSDSSSKDVLIKNHRDSFKNFEVIWTDAGGELFNRSLAINKGVISSKTPYIAIIDVDCLTKKENINMAIYLLDKGFEVVHPFDRKVQDIIDKQKFIEEYDFKTINTKVQIRPWADGGITFWNKQSFIKIGMQNEYFSGWGGEDNEIIHRANLFNLKHYRIDDVLYHLYHTRDKKRSENNFEQAHKILRLENKEECLKEISKWPCVIEAKNLIEKQN